MAARENPDYYGFVTRAIRGAGRRAAVEDLAELVELRAELDRVIAATVVRLRADEDNPASWAQVGRALGITRQAAQERFGGAGARKVGGQPAGLR